MIFPRSESVAEGDKTHEVSFERVSEKSMIFPRSERLGEAGKTHEAKKELPNFGKLFRFIGRILRFGFRESLSVLCDPDNEYPFRFALQSFVQAL